jgi:hypothetical protein
MPLTIIAQELVTVSLDQAATARQVTQDESGWIDLGPYQDLVILTYISEQGFQSGLNAAGSLNIEASPVKEDALFQALGLSVPANTTPSYWSSQANVHMTSGEFGRFLRWRLVGPTANGTATWTFRIVLSVNPAPRLGASP